MSAENTFPSLIELSQISRTMADDYNMLSFMKYDNSDN